MQPRYLGSAAGLGFSSEATAGSVSPGAASTDVADEQEMLKRVRAEAEALLAEADRQQEQARQSLLLREQKASGSPAVPGPPANRAALAMNTLNFPALSPSSAVSEACLWSGARQALHSSSNATDIIEASIAAAGREVYAPAAASANSTMGSVKQPDFTSSSYSSGCKAATASGLRVIS